MFKHVHKNEQKMFKLFNLKAFYLSLPLSLSYTLVNVVCFLCVFYANGKIPNTDAP